MKLTGKRCQCAGCGRYFSSLGSFDKHRTGVYDGSRRCRTEDEMKAKGMVMNARGVWLSSAGMGWRTAP